MSLRTIARHLRLHRQTIRRFATAQRFPERAERPPRPSRLASFLPYLQHRWAAGYHNAAALWRELGQQGFQGSYFFVSSLLRRWRSSLPTACRRTQGSPKAPPVLPFPPPSARTTAWWLFHELVRKPAELTPDQGTFVTQLTTVCPEVKRVQALVLAFASLLRYHQGRALKFWLARERERVPCPSSSALPRGCTGITVRYRRRVRHAGVTAKWKGRLTA
jgi:hypothetical protein